MKQCLGWDSHLKNEQRVKKSRRRQVAHSVSLQDQGISEQPVIHRSCRHLTTSQLPAYLHSVSQKKQKPGRSHLANSCFFAVLSFSSVADRWQCGTSKSSSPKQPVPKQPTWSPADLVWLLKETLQVVFLTELLHHCPGCWWVSQLSRCIPSTIFPPESLQFLRRGRAP